MANAILEIYPPNYPSPGLQRDLTDSTVLRNMPMAHTPLAIRPWKKD